MIFARPPRLTPALFALCLGMPVTIPAQAAAPVSQRPTSFAGIPLPASGPRTAAPRAQAPSYVVATDTWTGIAGDGKWSTVGNWDTRVPLGGDTVVFPNTPTNKIAHNDLTAGLHLAALSVTGNGYTIDGSGVSLDGGALTLAPPAFGLETLALPISLTSALNLAVNGSWETLSNLTGTGVITMTANPVFPFLSVTGTGSSFSGTFNVTDVLLEYTGSGIPAMNLSGGFLVASTTLGAVQMGAGPAANDASVLLPGDFTSGTAPLTVASLTLTGKSALAVSTAAASTAGQQPTIGNLVVAGGGAANLTDGVLLSNDNCIRATPSAPFAAIHHTGAGATNGPFFAAMNSYASFGAAEGSFTIFCGHTYRITYHAGANSNDVVLTPFPGYNILTGSGGIYSFGTAGYFGNLIDHHYPGPAIGLGEMPLGDGYQILTTPGGLYSFGSANGHYHGNLLDHHYPGPAVGIGLTNSGDGYAILNAGGGFYNFGDSAGYYGNLIDHHYPGRAVSFAWTETGHGYWILTDAGALYSFGDAQAQYYGNLIDHHYPGHATSITRSAYGQGYMIMTTEGGLYSFGDAVGWYAGNLIDHGYPKPGVAIATTP